MKKDTFLQNLTQKQVQTILFSSAMITMALSLIEPIAWLMFVELVLVAPLGIGYLMAILADRLDDSNDYKVELKKSDHAFIGAAISVVVGMIWAVVGTRIPVFPLNPATNWLFSAFAPKAVFLVWGIIYTGLGYRWAFKTVVPNAGRHAEQE